MKKILAYKKTVKLKEKDINKLKTYLTKKEKEKLAKYQQKKDKENFLIARFLLKNFIAQKNNIKIKDIIINTDNCNRPYLCKPALSWDFNISHSGAWVVMALSNESKVGIDVEKIKTLDLTLSQNYFSLSEQKYLKKQKKENRLNAFFYIWTLKEAYLKALGKGLYFPLNNFSWEDKKDEWQFSCFDIDPNYKLSLCSNKNKNFDLLLINNIYDRRL